MTKGMNHNHNHNTTLASSVASFGVGVGVGVGQHHPHHDVAPIIIAPIPRKPPCSLSSDHYRRSWPELAALSSSPERRAGQEILSILFSRAAVMSPTGNSIPPPPPLPPHQSQSSSSACASISPSKSGTNRHHRFSYDARMVSSAGRMVGAMTLNDDDDDDDDVPDDNNIAISTTTTSTPTDLVDDHDRDRGSSSKPSFSHHQQRRRHHQSSSFSSSSSSSLSSSTLDGTDNDPESWDNSIINSSSLSGTRLESMSPTISSDSPSPAFLLGVTPPKRADNPLSLDHTFFSLASSSMAIGAELGLLNFSPPLRDAH